jgi:hypothetical protein
MTATWTGKIRRLFVCAFIASVLAGGAALFAYANVVTYTGQGLIGDGFGGFDLQTELCGVANGAEVDGPYLLWVLTATGATNANIKFANANPIEMTKTGNGAFKYVGPYVNPATLLQGTVVATYDGKPKNAQLVISHGCRPFTGGAWCSPGFWRNATDAAWALTGTAELGTNSIRVPYSGNTCLGAVSGVEILNRK